MVRTRQHSRRGGLAQDTTLKKIQDYTFIESSFQQDFPRLLADRGRGAVDGGRRHREPDRRRPDLDRAGGRMFLARDHSSHLAGGVFTRRTSEKLGILIVWQS
jgi:hypothetical protein